MKKLFIFALMAATATGAFAQEDAVKQVLKTKKYSEAAAIIKQNLGTMTAEQKAKCYNQLVAISMDKVAKEQAVINSNQMAEQFKQGKVEAYDTVGLYKSIKKAFVDATECNKFDVQPNEKGKVKPKFQKANQDRLVGLRTMLIQGGQYYSTSGDNKTACDYYKLYVDTSNKGLFEGTLKENDQFVGEVARVAALLSFQEGKTADAEKYVQIAMQDPQSKADAEDLMLYIEQSKLKTHADSVGFTNKLKEMYVADTSNQKVYALLTNMYSQMNDKNALNSLLDEVLARDPKNFIALATKGQNAMNESNWNEAIDWYKKAIEIDQTNPLVYTYLGFSLNNKAAEAADKMASRSGALSSAAKEQINKLYEESINYLKKAQELDPNREKANWGYPLYQGYYNLYGADDARTKEIESVIR